MISCVCVDWLWQIQNFDLLPLFHWIWKQKQCLSHTWNEWWKCQCLIWRFLMLQRVCVYDCHGFVFQAWSRWVFDSEAYLLMYFSWQLLNMPEERVEDGFSLPPEPVPEDGDMARLVLQHCVMPAYQFIIQVAPDQTLVTPFTFLISFHFWCCLGSSCRAAMMKMTFCCWLGFKVQLKLSLSV